MYFAEQLVGDYTQADFAQLYFEEFAAAVENSVSDFAKTVENFAKADLALIHIMKFTAVIKNSAADFISMGFAERAAENFVQVTPASDTTV